MKSRVFIGVFVLLCGSAVVLAFQTTRLFINGKAASNSVIERNGTAYVPLKDVASALGGKLQKTARGYEISEAGGANMIEGISGKVGDQLFNGVARFQVVKVIRGKNYVNQFSGDKQEITPFPVEKDLVVVVCRIKNGTKESQTANLPSGPETALTDTSERSYGPRTGLSIDCPSRGQQLLPGAAVDFALTFDIPTDAVLKDLVYQVQFFGTPGAEKKKFRVSLQ